MEYMDGQVWEKYDYAVTRPKTTVWAVSSTASLNSLHSLWSSYVFQRSVKCLLYTVGSLHEFLFAKYKMKYFIQYFQIGDIMIPSGYSREFCSENREMNKVTDSREFSKPGSRLPNPTHDHTTCVVAICDDCKSTFPIQQRNLDSFSS